MEAEKNNSTDLGAPRGSLHEFKICGDGDKSTGNHSFLRDSLTKVINEGKQFEEITSADIGNIEELLARLDEGRFHLAALGQFKRGKSTLLNALIGENALPSAVVPLTSIPTFVKSGVEKRVLIKFISDVPPVELRNPNDEELNAFLSEYVTEKENPNNVKNVAHVEVIHTSPILNNGVVLIDTPGIGSTFRHNTEATINFLPQCDAALFVVSPDPPVTEIELEFLKRIRGRVERLFVVFNKVDYLDGNELPEALRFLEKVLSEQAGLDPLPPVFCVSSKRALRARLENSGELWSESGMADIEEHLLEFLSREKLNVLGTAIKRKAVDICETILMRIRLKRKTYMMPLEELKKLIEMFEKTLMDVKRDRQYLGDILEGEHKRIEQYLESHCRDIRERAEKFFSGTVHVFMENSPGVANAERMVWDELAKEMPAFFEREMGDAVSRFEKMAEESLGPHFSRADEMIGKISRAASDLFEIPLPEQETFHSVKIVRPPYWVSENWNTPTELIPSGLIDRFLPLSLRKTRVEKRINETIRDIISRNVENLRWSVKLSMDNHFAIFGNEIDRRFADMIESTHGAITAAAEKRKGHSETADEEIRKLNDTESFIMELTGLLKQPGRE